MLQGIKITKCAVSLIWLPVCYFLFNSFVHADNIDNFLIAKMKEHDIPGMQVAIVQHNKIVKTAQYGLSNIQNNVPVNEHIVFNIASIKKAFTCVAVMQLVEQKK